MTDTQAITVAVALLAIFAGIGAVLVWVCGVYDRQANAADLERWQREQRRLSADAALHLAQSARDWP